VDVRRSSIRRWGFGLAALAMVLGACTAGGAASAADQGGRPSDAPAVTAPAPFTGHGSVDQAYALGATPGEHLLLVDRQGRVVGSGDAGPLGGLIVRQLSPGPGYTFRAVDGSTVYGTTPFSVLDPNRPPAAAFYQSQVMHQGLNYLTMRDGVKLAATVRLPPGKTLADGPFPTVIEESGYAIAAPHSLLDALLHTDGESTSDPLVPDTATAVGSVIAPLLGFATVSLQMRGTGCSGGAFDLFDLPTTYDGYDAVQIVGSQPWVKGHKVGMVGISFSGISQMFVAGTRPPDLAAIAPMSLTNDLYATGFPGGIYNTGFAGSWLAARVADAEAAPAGGEAWAKAEIAAGDTTCLANQALHPETQDIATLLAQASHRNPSIYDQRSPSTWAKRVDVPVFLSGAFQDEQTGGQWTDIIGDSLGPDTISRWLEFLDIYVAGEVPQANPLLGVLGPILYQQFADAPAAAIPAVRFTNAPTPADARQQFEQDTPRVRVLFDNGAGSAGPGAMQPVWEVDTTAWPPPAAVATTFVAGPGGTLAPAMAGTRSPSSSGGRDGRHRAGSGRRDPSGSNSGGRGGSDGGGGSGGSDSGRVATVSFEPNPAARPATDLPASANAWAAVPPYDWTPVTGSDGVGFISAPLTHDLVVAGPAAMDLSLRSTAPDTDLQVTVSEVRPDGQEMFVNTGLLRASDRALDRRASTADNPVPTYLASQASPLPAGRFTEVEVPITPFAYAFRAGSRIRVTITAPGGDRPEWAFGDTFQTGGKVTDTLALGPADGVQPTALVLSVLPGVTPPDSQPPCPSLRGEPCRTYVPAGNGG
jgi:predicted acyl esterase